MHNKTPTKLNAPMSKLPRSTRRSFIKALFALSATSSFHLPSLAHTSRKTHKDPIAAIFDDAFDSLPPYNNLRFSDIDQSKHSLALAVWLPNNISKQQVAQYLTSHKSRFPALKNTYIYDIDQHEDSPDSTNPQLPHELRIAVITSAFDESYQGCITIDTRPYGISQNLIS